MTIPNLTIDSFCTEQVATIEAQESVHEAQELMQRHGIRHLPVTEGGKCSGLLSQRDIHAAMAVKGANARQMKVADIHSADAYVTHPGSSLQNVTMAMAEQHIGSAVVTDEAGKVIGIFTATDALRALSRLLAGQLDDS